MKKILLVVTIILVFASVQSFEKIQHPAPLIISREPNASNFTINIQHKVVTRLPRCGDWHNPSEGGIFYKAFEEVFDDERCMWIIGSPGATGYTINIQFLGPPTNQPGSGQELIFTGVRHGGASAPILTTLQPSSTGSFTIPDCNIVIVTFYSAQQDGGQRSGFALQYSDHQDGNITTTSPLSTHHLIESPTFEFKYPREAATYASNELSALLFPPLDHFYMCKDKSVWYRRADLEVGCRDALYIYNLNVNASALEGKWEHNGSICNQTSHHITHEDVVLSLFQSDSSGEAAGFHYWYVGC